MRFKGIALPAALAMAAIAAWSPGGVAASDKAGAPGKQAARRSFGECPDGWVCLWSGTNYSGTMVKFQTRGVWINLGPLGFNDDAESWRNRTNDDARVAEGTGGAGDLRCLKANTDGPSFGTFNNLASSIRIYTVNTIC